MLQKLTKYTKFIFPLLAVGIITISSFGANTALAVDCPANSGLTKVGETCAPGVLPRGPEVNSIMGLVILVFRYALILAGVVAVAYIIWAGYNYIMSGGDSDKAKKARSQIFNALIGLAIILLALAMVRFVSSAVGNLGNPSAL
jgi:hypothetical protein